MQSSHRSAGRTACTDQRRSTNAYQGSALTETRVAAVMGHIAESFAAGDGAPSIDEIQAATEIASRSTVQAILNHLEHEAGLIRREIGQKRNIRLTEQGRALAAVAS